MLFCGIDLESTGKDPQVHSVTEVGVVLWDSVSERLIRVADYLVYDPDAIWDMQTVAITGITPEMCKQFGMPTQQALRQLLSWANSADVLVAHNGKTFDFPLLRAWAARFSLEMPPKLLLDTRVDIQWPRNYSQKLTYLAAEHGFVNRLAHCAVADVLTMIQILSMQPNLPQILEYAKMPEITIQALVSYDDRDKAKIRGYHWKGETKQWLKVIKEGLLDKEKEGLIDKNIDDDGNETQEIAFTIRQVS